ncbi:variable surface protein [Plasmodium gonderi]|uniref:Variable surface protein n=1 Tax=Plasmodium gonderi TaxID=77519 RepID=A0A1Y1JPG7_PLAGO|nr:variable surface protein [Plasmodium gonderi]GAW84506.1 variable surface protein [Plasmodium gonderi]
MSIIYKENYLLSLPSIINYRKLDEGINYCLHDEETKIREKLKIFKSIDGILQKLLDILCYMPYFSTISNSTEEYCNFFYYWFGNMIANIKHEEEFNKIINIFYDGLTIVGASNKCVNHFISNSIDDFKKLKSVYDYSINYSSIKQKLTDKKISCSQELKELVKDAEYIYDEMYRECITGNKKNYCNSFKKIFPNYPNGNKLHPLKCDLSKAIPSSRSMEYSPSIIKIRELSPYDDIRNKSREYLFRVFLPMMVISLISPVLYQFTPVKTWMHKLFREGRSLMGKIKDIWIPGLRQNFYESEKLNSYRNYFNLSYSFE